MNSLIYQETEKLMDSREIAELTGKRHDHVIRDIEEQIGKLDGGLPRFGDTYTNPQNGQHYKCYRLPYRETMILISGYSVELRAKVIDRWMELEKASDIKTQVKQKRASNGVITGSLAKEMRLLFEGGVLSKAHILEVFGLKPEVDTPSAPAYNGAGAKYDPQLEFLALGIDPTPSGKQVDAVKVVSNAYKRLS